MADTPGGKKAWSETEKIAYLVLLLDTEGKVDEKIRVSLTHPWLDQKLTTRRKRPLLPAALSSPAVACSRASRRSTRPTWTRSKLAKISMLLLLQVEKMQKLHLARSPRQLEGRKRKTRVDEDETTDDSPVKKKAGGRKTNDAATLIKQELIDEQEDLENSMEV
jgi:hypothetical protein